MSTLTKKFVSAALTTATTVSMSGMLLVAPVAQAQSTSDLQAQIAALLAQIAALQAQLNAGSGGSTGGSVACTFTRSLTVGSTGDDVKCLQQYLNANGYQVSASGAGSPGNESTYFGSLTRAAVAKWQAAMGVSPAVGYFGPLSRAKFAEVAPGTPGTPGTPGAPVPSAGVSARLASDSPVGSAVSGAGQINVGKYQLTAASGAGATVSGLTFTKVGVVSDTHINNLYLADETGAVVAQYSSLNNGVATFSGLNLMVGGGQTRTLTLRMDLSSSASAGNTIAWSLTGVNAGGATVSGLPVASNTLTVTTVSNPAIATATWDFNAVGSSVDAGTNNVQIANASVNVSNSPVQLQNVKFTLVGSANYSDFRNLKLMVNGTQVGSTVSSPMGDGTVVFDLSSANARLNTGNTTVDLYADIAGSPNRNIQVRILRPYDLVMTDTQYNTGISPSVTDDSNQITINSGSVTVQLASDTPTGNVPKGASNVTLGKFTIYAAGEAVKVKFIDLQIIQGSTGDAWTTLANVTEDIQNISLVDDAGNQIGSTISTVVSGTGNGQCTLSSTTTIACHLGTSASPINYVVPANTTRVLSAKVDILSTNDAPSLRAGLDSAGGSNLEGQTSFQTATSGNVQGAVLTVVNDPLTLAVNGAFSSPTYVAGANNVKIASFVLTASSAEGARVNTITLDKDAGTDAMDIQNVKVMVGSTQFGSTRSTVADGGTTLVFSGSTPITVPAGGSVTVDVYADILTTTSQATHASVIDFNSWTATGLVSNSAISAPSAIDGQSVVISSGATLTVALDETNSPSAKQIVMNSAENNLLAVRLTADNVEDVKVTEIRFLDTISNNTAGRTSFQTLKLFDGSTQVGGSLSPTIADTSTSTVTFAFGTPVVVPKNGSKTLILKGDVADFSSGAVSGSGHVWSVFSTSTVVAYGNDSNQAATVSGSASAAAQTVYRTKLSLTSSVIGSTTGRARQAVDDLATINWTASSAHQVVLSTVTLKFQGQAVSNGSTAFSVNLLKSDGSAFGGATSQTCTPLAGNSCSVTFSPAFTISAGSSQATKVRVNSSNFFDAASANESLSVTIDATGDVLWSDGTSTGIGLEASVVPFTVASVQY